MLVQCTYIVSIITIIAIARYCNSKIKMHSYIPTQQ